MRFMMGAMVFAVLVSACGSDSKATPTRTVSAPSTVAVATKPAATASACPTAPSGPQFATTFAATATAQSQGMLTSVAATASACADTVTFTFNGAALPSYEVKYVPAAVNCGSGMPVFTAGSAQITARFEPAVAHDDNGNPSVSQQSRIPNLSSVKELKSSCDFEGVVTWVIGTEARYYTVTPLQNPPRLVVDVYH